MPILELTQVDKSFGTGHKALQVLKGLNLTVEAGEFVAIVGFSGSGKTTLINLLAGLTLPDQGSVKFKNKPITGPSPQRGLVFQSYSLLPWLSVTGNIALAVNQVFPEKSPAQRKEQIEKYIHMVGLSHAADRKPDELSGGMRQRVGIARALAMSPEVLLLDEPLSALDALTRANLQDEIERIWSEEKKTVILITNDVDEGLLLADRIIPLNPGPGSCLGPAFKIDLARPRKRTDLNDNVQFKELRSQVTRYLIEIGMSKSSTQHSKPITLPNLLPNTLPNYSAGPQKKVARTLNQLKEAKYLEIFALEKTFETPTGPLTVVKDFHLNVKKGEFISIIGHSGCGKSTVLSMCAGLTPTTGGGIVLDQKEVTSAGPDRGVVFQAPSLFPWMSAYDNVRLGVEKVYPHGTAAEKKDIINYYLERVGLQEAAHQLAGALSNGMKQRVGIARAFALAPKLLLLDEPFGMLDSLTRMELQDVLMEVWNRTRVTAIMVTHDVDEAIRLSDKVVMMTNGPQAKVGKILEIDLPRPRNRVEMLKDNRYYQYRSSLIGFLEECSQNKTTTTQAS